MKSQTKIDKGLGREKELKRCCNDVNAEIYQNLKSLS